MNYATLILDEDFNNVPPEVLEKISQEQNQPPKDDPRVIIIDMNSLEDE
jgi:hypothetical protein